MNLQRSYRYSVSNVVVLGGAYRYSFNGKESDSEVKGAGNSIDFGARMLDPRLGRWLSIDPMAIKYPSFSPYNFVANSPLMFIDLNGEDIWIKGEVNGKKTRVKFEAGKPAPKDASPFVKDVFASLNQSIDEGRGKSVLALSNDNEIKLKIVEKKSKGSSYYNNGKIKWKSNEGIYSVILDKPSDPKNSNYILYPDDERTRFSPARILEHEVEHAKNDLVTGDLQEKMTQDPTVKSLTNAEEERVIKTTDNTGGKLRFSHQAIPFETTGPFEEEGYTDYYKEGKKSYTSPKKSNEIIIEKGRIPVSEIIKQTKIVTPKE